MSYEIDEKKGKVKLTPIEAIAYFWTSRIRNTVREIITSPIRYRTKDDIEFSNLFYGFTEHDWRKLYLDLTKFIEKDVANYVSKRTDESDFYNQGTPIGSHNRINEALFYSLTKEIPDVRLVPRTHDADTTVYTDGKVVFSVKGGEQDRNWKLDDYEPRYTITGDEDQLYFYNQVLATMLNINARGFHPFSKYTLKSRFCDEYRRFQELQGNYISLEDVQKKFDDSFHIITQINDIATSSYHRDDYYFNRTTYDCFGLEDYQDLAREYADVILKEDKLQGDNSVQYGRGEKK